MKYSLERADNNTKAERSVFVVALSKFSRFRTRQRENTFADMYGWLNSLDKDRIFFDYSCYLCNAAMR